MCNFQQCAILSRIRTNRALYLIGMAVNGTLLCIHRDPAQLSLLERSGFELVTATNGHDGLRLFMSRPVDAIVLDYHLGLLDGGVVAAEMKKVKPTIPIVLLAHDRGSSGKCPEGGGCPGRQVRWFRAVGGDSHILAECEAAASR